MDDQILSQTNVAVTQAPIAPGPDTRFPALLERFREDRELSKADLAKRAGLDPSSITRFEKGDRNPDRETVVQLAGAMVLPVAERDRLLAAAGFRSEVWDDPLLVEIGHLLADRELPDQARQTIRSVLEMAAVFGRLQRSPRA